MQGYIKLFRKFVEWEWYSDITVKSVFLHLLLSATYKPTRFRGVELQPGDVIVGREKLAEELGVTPQKIRTALKKLEDTGEIVKKSTNKFSIVTLVNWGIYQSDDFEEQPTTNQQLTNNQPTTNQQLTNNQPTTNQQLTTFKNIRNKEYNNIINNISGGGDIYNTHARTREALDCYIDMTDEIAAETTRIAVELFGKYTSRHPSTADVVEVYNQIRHRTEGGWNISTDKVGLLEYAFEQASRYNQLGWHYISGILTNLRDRGLKTKEDCELYDMEDDKWGT